MPKTLKVALAGAGAFGLKHLDAIKLIDGVEAVSLVGRGKPRAVQACRGRRIRGLNSSVRPAELEAVRASAFRRTGPPGSNR